MALDTILSSSLKKQAGGNWPKLGCGVGLRREHYSHVLENKPAMDFFEVVTENYLDTQGRPLSVLETVRRDYPVAFHGVSLSIGSADPLNRLYMRKLKNLIGRIGPAIVSDHLCWSAVNGHELHDLLPLPFTEEALDYIAARVQTVQAVLRRPILLENVSTYVTYKHSTMPEWEFLAELARRSGCGILLDLNNVYVNAINHGFSALDFVRGIPPQYVGQFHLAGHSQEEGFLFDTHDQPVPDPVWALYREALARFGAVSTLIERDAHIPPFEVLAREAADARRLQQTISVAQTEPVSPTYPAFFPKQPLPVSENRPESLRAFERWFEELILGQKDWTSAAPDSLPVLPADGRVSPRLSVYRGGYLARQEESLRECYEAVAHLIGPGRFQTLARQYADNYRSDDPNLSSVGKHLPEFLLFSELSRQFPFLPDLADLERSVMQVFHTGWRAPAPLTAATLNPQGLERTMFLFQPAMALAFSRWPVLDLWRARRLPVEDIDIDLKSGAHHVLIFKRGTEVYCELLNDKEFELIKRLQDGASLPDALRHGDLFFEPVEIRDFFSRIQERGLIAGIKFLPAEASVRKPEGRLVEA